jgi:hypothetical protein
MAIVVQSIERKCAERQQRFMSTQEVFVLQFAKLFHHYREALSPQSEPVEEQLDTWNTIPFEERNRMVAAARLALLELETTGRVEEHWRRYFAKPGQAEWGC